MVRLSAAFRLAPRPYHRHRISIWAPASPCLSLRPALLCDFARRRLFPAPTSDLHWFSEADFLQLFRLVQLVAEYLLYVQETLHRRNVTLEDQLRSQSEYIAPLEGELGRVMTVP